VLQRRDPGVVPATHRRRSQESYQFEYTWRDPRDRLYKREIRPGIIRAVRAAKLSPDCLCAIWAWVRGRVGEFARNRGVPESTVRVWVHRALKALRLHLEREGLGPD
jgi:hypothetical protein